MDLTLESAIASADAHIERINAPSESYTPVQVSTPETPEAQEERQNE